MIIINNYDNLEQFKIRKEILIGDLDQIKRKTHFTYKILNFKQLNNNKNFKKTLNTDFIILSGSHAYLSYLEIQKKYENIIKLIKKFEGSILGICFGHQLIGFSEGFKIDFMKDTNAEFGIIKNLEIKTDFKLFNDGKIAVELKHRQEIKWTENFEDFFNLYSSSEQCKIQAIKHKDKEVYSVQFHPESNLSNQVQQDGLEIFRNFINSI